MGKYSARIDRCNGGYKFYIFPGNNKSQPVGESAKIYNSITECEESKEAFLAFIRTKALRTEDGVYVRITVDMQGNYKKYHFEYWNEQNEKVFVRKPGYVQKASCIKEIDSIYNAVKKGEI